MFNDYPDVLSVTQAADALSICEASVYRMVKDRDIGSCRVGRRILIPKICLIDYLNSARRQDSGCSAEQACPA